MAALKLANNNEFVIHLSEIILHILLAVEIESMSRRAKNIAEYLIIFKSIAAQ